MAPTTPVGMTTASEVAWGTMLADGEIADHYGHKKHASAYAEEAT